MATGPCSTRPGITINEPGASCGTRNRWLDSPPGRWNETCLMRMGGSSEPRRATLVSASSRVLKGRGHHNPHLLVVCHILVMILSFLLFFSRLFKCLTSMAIEQEENDNILQFQLKQNRCKKVRKKFFFVNFSKKSKKLIFRPFGGTF